MTKYTSTPAGVCARQMDFEISDDGIVSNVRISGGCPGNSQGVARLAEGRSAEELIRILSGIRCGAKPTSCPDQLAKAVQAALNKK